MKQKYNFCPPLVFVTLKMLANKTAMYIGEAISERQFNDAIKFSCSKSKLKCSSCDAESNDASHPKSNRLKSWILQLSQWVLKECVPVSRPKEFVRASATQESEQWSRFSSPKNPSLPPQTLRSTVVSFQTME